MRWSILLFCFFSRVYAQDAATAAFDSAVVETGEAFMLHVVINTPPDTIDLTAWDSLLPQSQVIKRSGWQLRGNVWQSDLTFITFDAAELQLPPILVRLKNGESVPTNPTQLTIIATPVPSSDLNDMADIKDIHREATNWTDYIWLYWLLGGLLTAILIAWWFIRARQKRRPATRITTGFYKENALEKLQQLERQQLWQNGQIKTYYAGLSFIVREFIGFHLGIKALESSSADLIEQINGMDISPALKSDMITLLNNADLAKFAKGLPEMAYHPQAINDARRFISSFQTLLPQATT